MAVVRDKALDLPLPPSFRAALRGPKVAVVAEVKRSSPSKGSINAAINAVAQARLYADGGAAAISVLTEPSHFGGSLLDLSEVCDAVEIPVLRKDFIVHPVQLWQARAAGASAALLIVRALPPGLLENLTATAAAAGLDVIHEVRNAHELERAISAGASIVGVNNRDLETLVIDSSTAPALIPRIPAEIIAVAESGMGSPSDAEPAVAAGADALLIGSALSASADPLQATSMFTRFERTPR